MAEQRAPVLLALQELRSELVRQGDDVAVIRERVTVIGAEVLRLAELEERRTELEHASAAELVEERRARSAEQVERSRWLRTTIAERILVPLLSAAVAFLVARCTDHPETSPDPAPSTEMPDASPTAAP